MKFQISPRHASGFGESTKKYKGEPKEIQEILQSPEISLKKYKEQLPELIDKIAIQSKVAICTLPPIGENMDSAVNKHVNEFNDYIELVATQKKISLLI